MNANNTKNTMSFNDDNIIDEAYIDKLTSHIYNLEQQIKTLKLENETLNLDVLTALHEKDTTPQVLLFFSALNDPNIVSIFQQLHIQLQSLRTFADGSEHMDFNTLKRRIHICICAAPTLDKFLNKYNSLYKKWINMRLHVYRNKHLTGGDADAHHICPLCMLDMRSSEVRDYLNIHNNMSATNNNNSNNSNGISVNSNITSKYKSKAKVNVSRTLLQPLNSNNNGNISLSLDVANLNNLKMSNSTNQLRNFP